MKVCLVVLGVLSPALLITSIALLAARVMQNLVDDQVKKVTVLENNTDAFELWEHPNMPAFLHFYFFNLTNPLEVVQGEIPIVRELGPYTYREEKNREDVHIFENGSKVSSFQPTIYFFEPSMSVGDQEVDRIMTVNLPALVAMNLAKATPFRLPTELILLIYQEHLFTSHTVQELLWGYTDKFLHTVHKFVPTVDPEFGYFKKVRILLARKGWLPWMFFSKIAGDFSAWFWTLIVSIVPVLSFKEEPRKYEDMLNYTPPPIPVRMGSS